MFRIVFVLLALTQVEPLFCQNTTLTEVNLSRKLSPGTRLFLQHPEDKFLFFPDINGRVPALVQLEDTGKLPQVSSTLIARYGNILSARLNKEEMMALVNDRNVVWIDVSFRLNRVKLLNDTTRILSRVNEVQTGTANGLPMNYLGTGVIAGIVDIGFQPDNPNFLNGDGTVWRIKKYWHQNEKSGTSPAGFSYGSEYTTPAAIKAARDDDGTHGTHVAGITAGSGFTTPNLKYRGMAPDADLVFVTIKYTNDTIGGSALGDYVVANPTILDAFKYIFDYAESVNKPAVCNLSWGMHTGPHDGTSLFDKAVESLTGAGKIVVGSAGNDGGSQMHVGAQLSGDTLYTFAIDRSRNDYKHENVYVDAWGDSAKPFAVNVALLDTFGQVLVEIPFFYASGGSKYKQMATNGTDTLWYTMAANPSFVNNGKPEILMMLESNRASFQRIRIGFTGQGNFHAWNSGQTYRWTGGSFLSKVKGTDKSGIYLVGTQATSVGENGGTGKATITVGSYIARNNWIDINGQYRAQNWLQVGDVSGFSSRGKTPDGRLKPDISAPGQLVASSVNYRTFAGWMGENSTYKSTYDSVNQYWTLFSGTSMSSPHVAGIVALMLQANPELTPSEVRGILQSTALRDTFTGKDSNIHFGYGKVNAFAAVKRVVQLRLEQHGTLGGVVVYPNPANNSIQFIIPGNSAKNAQITLSDITGKMCRAEKMILNDTGSASMDISSLSDGLYMYHIQINNAVTSGKIIVRH